MSEHTVDPQSYLFSLITHHFPDNNTDEAIGKVFVRSVGILHGDGSERLLWAKAYSAFLRDMTMTMTDHLFTEDQ